MSHHWDTGIMVRKPSWHKQESAVLEESPSSWDEGRIAAGLTWDVETAPVYAEPVGANYDDQWATPPEVVPGYQVLRRDDTGAVLSVQPNSYRVVRNEEFGHVIDAVLGLDEDERPNFEAIFSLYGGKMIIALCYFPTPLVMPWDPSQTYTYCALNSRHDGNGGVRGIPTNVRVQCANTWNQAEQLDGRSVGFTIRHTSNFQERLGEVRRDMILARGESDEWVNFAEQLALWKATPRKTDAYLKKMFPVSDDMEQRQMTNAVTNRERVRAILSSKSCEGIADNGYGLLMATTEWSDHVRTFKSDSSYIGRQLLTKQEPKARAGKILASMAGIKL